MVKREERIFPLWQYTLVPLGYEFVSVTEDAGMAIGLDTAEFDAHFHPDFQRIDITISDLRQQTDAVGQLGDSYGIGGLVNKLRRRHANYAEGEKFSGIGQNYFLKFSVTAFGADKAVREKYFSALFAFASLKAVPMGVFSMFSCRKHYATSKICTKVEPPEPPIF
jgi:hypothetical protein